MTKLRRSAFVVATLTVFGMAAAFAAIFGWLALMDALLPEPWETIAGVAPMFVFIWWLAYKAEGARKERER